MGVHRSSDFRDHTNSESPLRNPKPDHDDRVPLSSVRQPADLPRHSEVARARYSVRVSIARLHQTEKRNATRPTINGVGAPATCSVHPVEVPAPLGIFVVRLPLSGSSEVEVPTVSHANKSAIIDRLPSRCAGFQMRQRSNASRFCCTRARAAWTPMICPGN